MTAIFLIPILIALLPALAWSWRSLLGIVLVIGGFLGFLWTDHAIHAAKPGYDGGIGDFLAVAATFLAGVGFACMTVARAAGLALQSRGWSRLRVLACDLLGVVAAVAIFVVPPAWHRKVTLRAAPAACIDRPVKVRIADVEVEVPNRPSVNIYLEGPLETGARYMRSAQHRRDICRRTADGQRAVEAAALTVGGYGWSHDRSGFCDEPPDGWGALMCGERKDQFRAPIDLVLLGPEAEAGSFARSVPTYVALAESRRRNPWKADAQSVAAGGKVVRYADDFLVMTTPEGSDAVAACRPFGAELHCQVDEPLTAKIRIGWEFRANDAEVFEQFAAERQLVRRALELMGVQ